MFKNPVPVAELSPFKPIDPFSRESPRFSFLQESQRIGGTMEGVSIYSSEADLAENNLLFTMQQNFIDKWGVKVLGPAQVEIDIRRVLDCSPIGFLTEAHQLALRLYDSVVATNGVFSKWEQQPIFTDRLPGGILRADLNVAESQGLNFSEMKAKGWLDLPVSEVAMAHAAFFIATGEDAFRPCRIVRVPPHDFGILTDQTNLCFHGAIDGLQGYNMYIRGDEYRGSDVGATRRIR
jgi:hypothetical protein